MAFLLIYNPQAGGGRARKILPEVLAVLKRKGLQVELFQTTHAGHGTEYLSDLDPSPYEGIIAAGGDGTLYEVINGKFNHPRPESIPPVGVLPMGTGNAFIRDMNLPDGKWETALDVIRAGKTRRVDVGEFQTQGKRYWFMNILGLGFVADVGEAAHKFKLFGNFSYTLAIFTRLIALATHQVHITLDGESLERENIFVEISNTRYTSNFLMAPEAVVDDGIFDVTLLSGMSRRKLITSFPKLLTGEHVHLPEVETFRAREIQVETDTPKVLTPDGEIMGTTPFSVTCHRQAVEVFWP